MALFQGVTVEGRQQLMNANADDGGLLTLAFPSAAFDSLRRVGYLFVIVELDFGIGFRCTHSQPIYDSGIVARVDLAAPVINNHLIVIATWNNAGLDWKLTA